MRDVVLARNALDPKDWVRYADISDLAEFLKENVGPVLPPHTRFYHGAVDGASDVTPFDEASTEALENLVGLLYVICYPEGPGQLAVTAGLFIVSLILSEVLPKPKPDVSRPTRQGSQNNTLSDRANTTRLLGRVPDIFGKVRATPDLIAQPYVTYVANQQVEIAVMILGRGMYDVVPSEVFEGDSRAETVQDLSVEVYPPGQMPTIGSPQITIGTAINTPVLGVKQFKAVNGQLLPAFNDLTIHGTLPASSDPDATVNSHMEFGFVSTGIGVISVPTLDPSDISEVTDVVQIGDIVELRFDPTCVATQRFSSPASGNPAFLTLNTSGFVPPTPLLRDDNLGYTVLNITSATRGFQHYADIVISIPAGKQAEWNKIPVFTGGFAVEFFNPAALLTPKFRDGRYTNEIGPFFVDDPNMQSLSLNFVADRGLFTDDGSNLERVNVAVTVRVAPADATGTAIGAVEEQVFTVIGSSIDLHTRAITATFVPGTFAGGRCLVSCMRQTQSLWRVIDDGQGKTFIENTLTPQAELNPIGGPYPASEWNPTGFTNLTITAPGIYKKQYGTIEDTVRWTHLYSLSPLTVADFGDTTLVMTRQEANKSSNLPSSRKLSMLATRKTNLWNGTAFVGPLQSNLLGRDTFFAILKDPLLGNIPDAQIDFPGIASAFGAVDTYFGDFATNFGATFDTEHNTLEDMLAAVANSCFCTAYREGGIIKVKPKIAVDNAIVLFNHRNMLPGSEQRTVAFGTEADYDGVKVDYADDAGNTIKTLTVPSTALAAKPLELSIVGLRDSTRAAFHAWRAFGHVLYQNTQVEFEALQEAALCVIDDKILVADTTRPETISGEIVGVSGLILTTSQNIPVATGGTLFLQHTDGTVEGIPAFFVETRQIAITTAPSIALVTDPNAGIRTGYTLVQSTDARSRGFLITGKSAQSRMTWQMQATNYSAGYYFADGLEAWFNPRVADMLDLSPYDRTFTIIGSFPTVIDADRGHVVSNDGTARISVTNPDVNKKDVANYTSYTKSAWLYKTAPGIAIIIGPSSGSGEDLLIWDFTEHIVVSHNAVDYITYPGMPAATWVMVTVAYDSVAPSHAGLLLLNSWTGLADDVRMYYRCLSNEDVNELYKRTVM